MESQLYEAALVAVRDCMGITGGETFLVVTDKAKRRIAQALWKAGRDLEAEAMMIEMIANAALMLTRMPGSSTPSISDDILVMTS